MLKDLDFCPNIVLKSITFLNKIGLTKVKSEVFTKGILDSLGIVGGLLGLIGLACTIWVIYDVLVNQKAMTGGKKVLWILAALFFSWIAALIYSFVVKKK